MEDVVTEPGHTWGIPGPTFLLVFVLTAALLVVGTLVHRRIRFAGRRPVAPDRLSPEQVAFLNGGPRLAYYTALGALRGTGAIGIAADRRFVPTGPVPAGVTPLGQAVYHGASQRPTARQLSSDQWVRGALTDLRTGLQRDGLVPARSARYAAQIGPALLFLVLLVGLARLGAAFNGIKAFGYLVLAIFVLLVTLLLLLGSVPKRTRAATWTLRRLREQYPYLAPARAPAFATYGPAGAAMGIALFGPASLWAFDPEFAAGAGVASHLSSSGYTSNDSTIYTGSCGGSDSGSGSGGGSDGGGGGGGGGGGCGG